MKESYINFSKTFNGLLRCRAVTAATAENRRGKKKTSLFLNSEVYMACFSKYESMSST